VRQTLADQLYVHVDHPPRPWLLAQCLDRAGGGQAIESLIYRNNGAEPWVILILMAAVVSGYGTFPEDDTAMLGNRGPALCARLVWRTRF